MRKQVVHILLVFVIAQFVSFTGMGIEGTVASSQIEKIGLYESSISQDLESELLELEVKYDIAVVENNFEEMCISLREIGLVYFKNNQLKLAEGYIWRSKIIAEKYGIVDQDLYGCALLAKINLKAGNVKESLAFEEEYLEILTRKNKSDRIGEDKESIEASSMESTIPVEQSNLSFFVLIAFFGIATLVIIGLLVLLVFKDRTQTQHTVKEERNVASGPVAREQPVELKQKKEKLDIDIQLDSINLVENEEEESVLEEVPAMRMEGAKPEVFEESVKDSQPGKVASHNFSSIREETPKEVKISKEESEAENDNIRKPISVAEIRQTRDDNFYDKSQLKKLPLWVSGIEHHFKNINSFKGIRFDFNCTGDFNSVPRNVYDTVTVFLKSFSDELVDSDNLLSVTTLMVNTRSGLVVQLLSKPIVADLPILPKSILNDFQLAFTSIPNCRLLFSINDLGDLKTVVKSVPVSDEVLQS